MSTQSARTVFYKIGAIASAVVFGLFLIGMIGIVKFLYQPGAAIEWLTLLGDNWLVMLFKLNLGLQASLTSLNILDLVIMAFFCVIFLALWFALNKSSKTWSLIAAVLPLLGIPIYILTGTAGRSVLLISVLIISLVMLRGQNFNKIPACLGFAASGLLFFAGDIATAIFSSSIIIALFIIVGYVLWMIWFLLLALKLFRFQ